MGILQKYLIICILFLNACSDNSQPTLNSEDKNFVKFYSDMLILKESTSNKILDTVSFKKQIDSIYNKYNLTEEGVKQLLIEYQEDIIRWRLILQEVLNELDSRQVRFKDTVRVED